MLRLENIHIENFRNLEEQTIDCSGRINIFTGLNGQGKTNFLESIYFLTVGRSFRTNQEQELISLEKNYFFIKGNLAFNTNNYAINIGYQKKKNIIIKVNGSHLKRSDYFCINPVVVFSPDDLMLLKEGPALRRKYLNVEGSRLKPLYLEKLKHYQRVVHQRNQLLKDACCYRNILDMLDPWNKKLIALGSDLIRFRISLLNKLEGHARDFFKELTCSREKMTLSYECSFGFEDLDNIEVDFQAKLNSVKKDEIKKGYTSVGPHLDDFTVSIDGLDAKRYASQGQQRTAVLALKMGEINLFNSVKEKYPIVLLDDVFSEFDRFRQQRLISFLRKGKGQSFISIASPLHLFRESFLEDSNIFTVSKGKIYSETFKTSG